MTYIFQEAPDLILERRLLPRHYLELNLNPEALLLGLLDHLMVLVSVLWNIYHSIQPTPVNTRICKFCLFLLFSA